MNTKTEKISVFPIILAVFLMLAVFVGCENEEKKPVMIDIEAVANELSSGVKFDDTLAKLDAEAVKYLYGTGDDISAVVYVGSGATAEEIAVFEAPDDKGGEEMLEIAEKHIADQIESYRNYVPSEVARLEKAVIAREGKYVLICVTNDTSAAREIINKAVGK
ncbi:MAG: DUF4358 domain-containing protein [Ruminococcaceae bacterium]|nr:DUF4358 domain-containing protein [Oscillospiraceae bacterium]